MTLLVITVLFVPLIIFAGENDEEYRNTNNVDENTLLYFEDTPRFENLSFDIDGVVRLKPKVNDFELVSFAPMSNKVGERWALVTVRNKASGRRFLKSDYLVATFANEVQSYAIEIDESVDGGQTLSKIIFFGINKFPIVMIEIQP
jgi:hypothetical protein